MAIGDNLVAAWDFSTGSGSTIVDVINSITLTLSGATFDSGGLLCNADGEYAAVTAPAALKITGGAISFGFNANILSAPPANYASYMGCSYSDNPATNPYWGWVLYKNDSGHLAAAYNNAGVYGEHTTSTAPTTGAQNFLVVIANGRRVVYRNGSAMATETTTGISAPTYDATAVMTVGDWVGGRNVNTRYFQAYVWNADKSADASAFNAEPDGGSWAFAVGPTIDTQPSNDTAILAGPWTDTTVSFTVAATTSGGTLTYQWQEDDGGGFANISNGGIYGGATTATLTLTGVGAGEDGYLYRCNVTDDNGTTATSSATLTVLAGETLTQPTGTTNGSGQFAVDGSLVSDDVTHPFTIVRATCEGVTKDLTVVKQVV